MVSKPIYYAHTVHQGPAPSEEPERTTAISASALIAFMETVTRDALLTFDDGYADNLHTLLPILEHYDRRATVFVTVGFIARTHPPIERVIAQGLDRDPAVGIRLFRLPETETSYNQLRRWLKTQSVADRQRHSDRIRADLSLPDTSLFANFLTQTELETLASHPLIDIQAHTVSHPDLTAVSNSELYDELNRGRRTLSKWLERPITEIAYPYGAAGRREWRMAAAVGYSRGYGTGASIGLIRGLPGRRRFRIPRIDLAKQIKSS